MLRSHLFSFTMTHHAVFCYRENRKNTQQKRNRLYSSELQPIPFCYFVLYLSLCNELPPLLTSRCTDITKTSFSITLLYRMLRMLFCLLLYSLWTSILLTRLTPILRFHFLSRRPWRTILRLYSSPF